MIKSRRFYKMMTKKILLIWLLIFFTGFEICSLAEQNSELNISVSAREKYDDNITYVKNNTEKDIITSLILEGDYTYQAKTWNIKLSGGSEQELFAFHPNFNNNAQYANMNFEADITKKDKITVTDSFVHSDEPRSFEVTFGRPGGRYSSYINKLDVQYDKELSKQLKLRANYGFDTDTFSRDDINNSFNHTVDAKVFYFFTSKTIGYAGYEFTDRQFHPGKDGFTNSVQAAVRQYLTEKLYIDVRAGLDFIDSFEGKKYLKPLIVSTLNGELTENTEVSIGYSKRYATTPYVEDYFNYWQIAGTISSHVVEKLNMELTGFFGKGEYIVIDLKDDLVGFSVDLRYDIAEHVTGECFYSLSDSDASDDSFDFFKNTVYVGL